MLNFDYLCMKYAQEIINSAGKEDTKDDKKLENNLRKALGVLQEDGVYAMFLWLEENADYIRSNLVDFLNGLDKSDVKIHQYFLGKEKKFNKDFIKFCEDLKTVARDEDLHKLLLMKKILERTLTYALYHAKIGEKNVGKG